MKRIFCVVFVLLLAVFTPSTLTVHAETSTVRQGVVSPLFANIAFLGPGLSINSSGRASCLGIASLYDESQTVQLTVSLQKQSGTSWSTVQSWTASGSGLSGVEIARDYYVVHGTYRVCNTAKVYSATGTLLETASVYSAVVTY